MKNVFFLLMLLTFAFCATAQNNQLKPKTLVELFTFEGCSSCPPAEELLQQMQTEKPDLIVRSYHVDYWDRLGWKDPFSKPEWTRRQNVYATALQTENLYMPQAVVNGSGQITGSNRAGINTLLKNYPMAQKEKPVQIRTTEKSGLYSVAYEMVLSTGKTLQVALVKRQAITVVKRGENGGRTLRHTNWRLT